MSETQIGTGMMIEGDVHSDAEVVVLGRMKGTIEARDVRIEGELDGDVIASGKVELEPDAAMNGNIRASRILIADGARFRGSVDMND